MNLKETRQEHSVNLSGVLEQTVEELCKKQGETGVFNIRDVALVSIAVSLKRIANALEAPHAQNL